jgi:hypothetical protein
MMSDDKTGLLKVFLGSLSGYAASRLASAVETDRLLDGRVLPHVAILEGLRPVLRDTNAGRTPTPLRLFCRPFEDILTCAARKTKQKGVIARASILLIWLWLGRDLLPAETEAYITETKALMWRANMPKRRGARKVSGSLPARHWQRGRRRAKHARLWAMP